MKYIGAGLLIIVLGFFLSSFHWMAGFLALLLVIPFLKDSLWRAFLLGFISFFLLWGGYAFWIDQQNDQLLSEQIGALFGNLSSFSLILVTAVLGAIPAGLFSWFIRWLLLSSHEKSSSEK